MHSAFINENFYPTPPELISYIMEQYDVSGKVVLEPSAGSGNIIDWLKSNGAKQVLACENHPELRTIAASKARLIADDFLTVSSEQVSHINMIVMNPPFTSCERHLTHAFAIAPPACKIVCILPASRLENTYSSNRRELKALIDQHGYADDLGRAFANAERKTPVPVVCLHLSKPGSNYQQEFEGFFLDDQPEQSTGEGLMPYNFIRDIVNRYVEACKVFDQQLAVGEKMNSLISGFFRADIAFQSTSDGQPMQRATFRKELQKSAWKYIFSKLNMQKYATRGLMEDINRFVEQQENIPFTMRNIYRMLEIVAGTHGQRMDRALMEVFDKLTQHYHDNRFAVEGWKTNSHYLLNPKFIMPYCCESNWSGGLRPHYRDNSNDKIIEDFNKALCYMTGKRFEDQQTLWDFMCKNNCKSGELYTWGFFQFRAYKKGTMHFRFLDEDLCWKFNRHISRIKGYPLYEPKPSSNKAA